MEKNSTAALTEEIHLSSLLELGKLLKDGTKDYWECVKVKSGSWSFHRN